MSLEPEFPHMAGVENRASGSCRDMLGDNALEVYRHFISAKRRYFRPQADMQRMQGGLPELCGSVHGVVYPVVENVPAGSRIDACR